MITILRLIQKDAYRFLNDKRAVILTFIVPMVLIIIFGNIFGGDGGVRGKAELILVNRSSSFVAKYFEMKLDSSKALRPVKTYTSENGKKAVRFDEETAKEWVRTGKISAAVVLPEDFFEDTSSAVKIKFYFDPKNEIESNIIQGNMQQLIFTSIPKLIPVLLQRKAVSFIGKDSTSLFMKGLGNVVYKYFGQSPDSFVNSWTRVDSASLAVNSEEKGSGENFISGIIKFDSEQLVGKKITNPGLTRSVGGWAMMFLLFSLTGAATSIFEEKNEGTLKRLLCMPVTRTQILWSKYIYAIILGVIQLLAMFLFAWAFFGVEIFANFWNLLILIIASAAAAVSFGMLITSVSKTFSQANGIATLLILVMSSIGGSWFPTSFLPGWMQVISKGTLTYWSMEGFLQVLWRHSDFAGIAANVLILLSIAVLINSYALLRFRRGII